MCLSQWKRMAIHDRFLNQVGCGLKRDSVADAHVEFSTASRYSPRINQTLRVEDLAVMCLSVQAGLCPSGFWSVLCQSDIAGQAEYSWIRQSFDLNEEEVGALANLFRDRFDVGA